MANNEASAQSRLDYAHKYIKAGFKILPLHWINEAGGCTCGDHECRSPGKHPLVVEEANMYGGVHSATDDIELLGAVFAQHPRANLGLAIPDTMFVIDIDPRNGGDVTIDMLESQYGKLPETAMQMTGGGGFHYLYSKPNYLKVRGKLGAGVDIKSGGGYIVAEPSVHESGGSYTWELSSSVLDGVAVVDSPAWVINKIGTDAAKASHITPSGLLYGVSNETVDELRSALAHLTRTRPDLADDYHTWINVGLACKSIGDAGFDLWTEWSESSDKYDANYQFNKWHTFHPAEKSYRSVFYLASENGWQNPAAKKPGDDAAQIKRGSKFSDVSQLVKDIKPIDWLVRDYLETNTLALMYGPPGCGKSFAAVDFAASVATGIPWIGHQVKQGGVFYLAGEGHNGLARRFRAWEVERGIEIPAGVLWKSDKAVQMLDANSVMETADEIWRLSDDGANPPALIVLDTLARNFGPGDENSTQDMSKFIEAVDHYLLKPWPKDGPKCTVLIVHHSGHNQERARGSSALKAAVDIELEVTKDENGAVAIRGTKMKDAEPPRDKLLRFKSVVIPDVTDEDGNAVTSAVLDVLEGGSGLAYQSVGKLKSGDDLRVLDVLKALRGGWMPFRELAGSVSCTPATAQRAVERCVKLGVLEKNEDGEGYTLSQTGFTELAMTGAFLRVAAPRRPWDEEDD